MYDPAATLLGGWAASLDKETESHREQELAQRFWFRV